MKSALRFTATGAIALALTTAVAMAEVPSRHMAQQAAQELKSNNRSLADIIKAAEERTGGTAVAVAIERAPFDASKDRDASQRTGQDATRTGQDATRTGQDSTRTGQDQYKRSGMGADKKLEYRVTCLVDNTKLKDVYVCAHTAEVSTVRNANEHTRWTRSGHDRFGGRQGQFGDQRYDRGRYGDRDNRYAQGQYDDNRYAQGQFDDNRNNRYGQSGDDQYRGGVSGQMQDTSRYDDRYSRDDRYQGDRYQDDRYQGGQYRGDNQQQPRTNFDPNRQNHHDRYADNRYSQDDRNQNWRDNQNNQNWRDNQNQNWRDNQNNQNWRDDQNRNQNWRDNQNQRGMQNRNQPGQMILGSRLLSASVTNNQNQDLGDVDDVVVNPENGKIVYTAVSYGGLLGIGEKHFAIPGEEINNVTQDKVYLDIEKSEFENSEGFKKNEWPNQPDATLSSGTSVRTEPAPAQIKKLSDIIGKPLKTNQDEKLGKIDNVVLDTTADRIAYLIVDADNRDGLVAVPCAAIEMRDDRCVVNISKDRFSQLPTFKEDNYPSWTNANWNQRTHSDFNVQPYWSTQSQTQSQTQTGQNTALDDGRTYSDR